MGKEEKKEQVELVKEHIRNKMISEFGITIKHATDDQIYRATALAIRDEICRTWATAREHSQDTGEKCVAYISAEFLLGRAFTNNLINLDRYDVYKQALDELGFDIDGIEECEADPGVGTGGLGRLGVCLLDSLATLEVPAIGYGIHYDNGFFRQKIVDGRQTEEADNWLDSGEVWEIDRIDRVYPVRFGGRIEECWDQEGHLDVIYHDCQTILARAIEIPIVGYKSQRFSTLRLWKAISPDTIDFERFNSGDYAGATASKQVAETISKFLYPNDSHYAGKELRLKQFYFMTSATIQSIVDMHKCRYGDLHTLPEKIAIQINDTHPTLAIPELIRILIDEEDFTWEEAIEIAEHTFNYTNHTVMPEALEKWPSEMLMKTVPRIYRIIETIDAKMRDRLWHQSPGDIEKMNRTRILKGGEARMANLCTLVCGNVNGVSQLHGDLLKTSLFRDFYMAFPEKFCGITNGITQRRWLKVANPALSDLVDGTVGEGFMKDWTKISELEPYAQDAAFRQAYREVKENNKKLFAEWMKKTRDVELNPTTIYDVQAKRLHEYKRQLLKALHIISLYDGISEGRIAPSDITPTTFIFAAKAAPGYAMAKEIIRLINSISAMIEANPATRNIIPVVFLENYDVTAAQHLMPASDISEQISTAGTEASGTGNMKFMLNGALTLGTMDGANVEIAEQVGPDNIFIFGANVDELARVKSDCSYNPQDTVNSSPVLQKVLSHLVDGSLSLGGGNFQNIHDALLYHGDPYFVLYDFADYDRCFFDAQARYRKPDEWYSSAVINTAKAGFFSSDRTINEYCQRIWGIDIRQ